MRNLVIVVVLIVTFLSACSTLPVRPGIDYDKINNYAFLKCVANRIAFYHEQDYIPTSKGFRNIQAFCYHHLKTAGLLK